MGEDGAKALAHTTATNLKQKPKNIIGSRWSGDQRKRKHFCAVDKMFEETNQKELGREHDRHWSERVEVVINASYSDRRHEKVRGCENTEAGDAAEVPSLGVRNPSLRNGTRVSGK